jgi:hypothetical protein
MLERQECERADLRALLERLRTQFLEYGRLCLILAKLYFQSRVLIMQNLILTCRLRMWDAVFVYFKIQIFLIRLAHGFPLTECWPAEKSLPPLA